MFLATTKENKTKFTMPLFINCFGPSLNRDIIISEIRAVNKAAINVIYNKTRESRRE